ncbi:MAG: DUF1007 family protein [Pseudomonadota bacterium]|nr:DUF1007 family protein [Pseudomonadota bacterium]
MEAQCITGYLKPMKIRCLSALFAFFVFFAIPSNGQAHPHVWIDMKTKVLFNKDGYIQALEIYWLFDPIYSAFLTLTVENIQKKGAKNAHSKFTEGMLNRLKKHNYFTEVTVDGKRIKPSHNRPGTSGTLKTGKNKDRFWSKMTLNFSQPIDPKNQKFVYSVYDPTYYIEILHAEKQPAFELVGIKGDSCVGNLIRANPDEEIRTFAASLDKTQSGGNKLGKLFAEKIVLQCK